MYAGSAVFVVSKPLQLMVVLSLLQQLKFEKKPLIAVMDGFNNAEKVTENLKKRLSDRCVVEFFPSGAHPLKILLGRKVDHLFLDSDVGFVKAIQLLKLKHCHPNLDFYVFEEGRGTYRTDMYGGLKKNVFDSIGVATCFGASPLTKGIFVINDVEYQSCLPNLSNKVTKIENDIQDIIKIEQEILNDLFYFNVSDLTGKPGSKHCSVYLCDWQLNKSFLNEFQMLKGDLFCKRHPHSKIKEEILGVFQIESFLPSELVLFNLLLNYEKVVVFHENSSTCRYLKHDKLHYQCVSEVPYIKSSKQDLIKNF